MRETREILEICVAVAMAAVVCGSTGARGAGHADDDAAAVAGDAWHPVGVEPGGQPFSDGEDLPYTRSAWLDSNYAIWWGVSGGTLHVRAEVAGTSWCAPPARRARSCRAVSTDSCA